MLRSVALLPRSLTALSGLWLSYRDGQGVLRSVMSECTRRGFAVHHLSTGRETGLEPGSVGVHLQVRGSGDVNELAAALSDVSGVLRVEAQDANVAPV